MFNEQRPPVNNDHHYCAPRVVIVLRFDNVMIFQLLYSACDKCEEWFHGDCVKVSEKESKYIKSYFCKKCRIKNPKLSIIYKSKYKEMVKYILIIVIFVSAIFDEGHILNRVNGTHLP